MERNSITPPGWPQRVHPPADPDWETTAASWLLDQCPPEYRSYQVMRRHTVVLARFAALHVEASLEAARRGMNQARHDLSDLVPLDAMGAALLAWQREEARLQSVRREVGLVEAALHGRRHVPRL